MDNDIGSLVIALLLLIVWIITTARGHYRQLKEVGRSPPGPTRWPAVGNIFQLGLVAPHESFVKLAKKHGPVMTIWLGSMNTVVISSNEAARVMFKNHDVVLAGRKIYEAMKGDYGNEGSLITAQYGQHWRMLRRLCTAEFFTTSRLDAMRVVRRRCIDQMVQFIHESGGSGTTAIDIRRFFFLMTFNLMGNLIFSKDLLDPKSERGSEFFFHAGKVMEFAGKANVADFFPILRWLDPQGIRRKTQFHVNHAFDVVGEFLRERLGTMENDCIPKKIRDYLDVLLEYRGDGTKDPYTFGSRTINVIVFPTPPSLCKRHFQRRSTSKFPTPFYLRCLSKLWRDPFILPPTHSLKIRTSDFPREYDGA
ncbi:unnamed protein product [Fraxinus pennsylvanica]|uniref:Cytochrome P450 n=1 Tax=Fraxinus pennsylvanica TaxID=56036 RepID=A0AAD2ADK0_9LAMI|nr:unnamed protein product [Fraxinus pennsylvanica]